MFVYQGMETSELNHDETREKKKWKDMIFAHAKSTPEDKLM